MTPDRPRATEPAAWVHYALGLGLVLVIVATVAISQGWTP